MQRVRYIPASAVGASYGFAHNSLHYWILVVFRSRFFKGVRRRYEGRWVQVGCSRPVEKRLAKLRYVDLFILKTVAVDQALPNAFANFAQLRDRLAVLDSLGLGGLLVLVLNRLLRHISALIHSDKILVLGVRTIRRLVHGAAAVNEELIRHIDRQLLFLFDNHVTQFIFAHVRA